MSRGQLFVISAPSGAGKTTILKTVLTTLPAVGFSVSHTTRSPRPGEENGRDYFFVDREEFSALREQGDFLEWAEVHGNFYGTSGQTVNTHLGRGQDLILDIDVQGAEQLRARPGFAATFIFIAPPSLAELKRRLSGRQTDSAETIALRLHNATRELEAADRYDYIIINDELDQAKAMLTAIILEKRAAARRGYDGKPLNLRNCLGG
jgi:guanylate kinase